MNGSFRFWKIVATIWPSLKKETILKRFVNYVDVFRINLSHWGLPEAQKYVEIIRKIDASKAIMFDTKGPEVRVKNSNIIDISKRKKIDIYFSPDMVESDDIYIDYPFLSEIKKGVILIIDDNKVVLRVDAVKDDRLVAKVLMGSEILPNKSVNFKWYSPKLDFLTEEDKNWILWAIKNHIVFIAVSFVRDANDILQLRKFLSENWWEYIKIISKIETIDALENIDDIIKLSDWIMIARWDLGAVIPLESLTRVQLDIIKKCNMYWKPVIVATQVLPTMVSSPVPTRAEVDEVVYNIKHWVDAFMLSEETAVGKFVGETLERLNNIILSNQDIVDVDYGYNDLYIDKWNEITDYIIWQAYKTSKSLDIKAIICPTETGYTPTRLSTLKPSVPIIAFTKSDETFKYLNILWGVKAYKISDWFDYEKIKTLWKEIVKVVLRGNVNIDDKILIVHSTIAQNIPWMINGMEIYKYKDM